MYIADLHIHSRFSRATSKDMNVHNLAKTALKKGINLLGTGDILHPEWRKELKENLKKKGEGIYEFGGVDFMLTGEISNVFTRDAEVKKVHTVLLFPDFETVEKACRALAPYGNLTQDGRPTFGMDLKDTISLLLEISENIGIIPAHVWTPWFSIFGSNSGFDSIEEALGELSDYVLALETGLSSDPPMNWRLSKLDRFTLVSNSDAHSPSRIGREANVFSRPLDYFEMMDVIKNRRKEFLFTIEFFPEEGKYHYDGHRNCGVSLSPKESLKLNNICPVCKKPLTVGVLHRVEVLADREEGFKPEGAIPYKHLVPLEEIIAEALGYRKESESVRRVYEDLILKLGSEMEILLEVDEEELFKKAPNRVAKGVMNVRRGDVEVIPGYDGVYGVVKVFREEEEIKETKSQMQLF